MKKILITGVPGSGKSTVSNLLIKNGYNAVDGLSRIGLSVWINKQTGEADTYHSGIGADWLNNHLWTWDQDKLQKLFDRQNESTGPFFISGVVPRINEALLASNFLDRFDLIFSLKVPVEVMQERLIKRLGQMAFGKGDGEIEYVLSWHKSFEEFFSEYGAEILDATLPPETLYKIIVEKLESLKFD